MKKTLIIFFIGFSAFSQTFEVVNKGYYYGVVGETKLPNRTTDLKALTDVQEYLDKNNLELGEVVRPRLEVKRKKTTPIDTIDVDTTTVTNMADEIAYFNATFVPVTAKDSLQYYLDTYGSIRLENADYGRVSGKPINIGSNQSIYGHPTITEFPDIHILAGSTNVHLENIYNYQTFFDAGAPITNSVFKNIKYSVLRTTGGMIEDNLFINLNSVMNFDMSASGYYRNNRIYRQQVHGPVALILKGNSATPSYGNINVWSNYLTPQGSGVIIDNIADMTFIGIDSEGWNIQNLAPTGAMFMATNMGDLKMGDIGGGSSYNAVKIPAFKIQADNIYLFRNGISNQGSSSLSSADGNVFSVRTFEPETYKVENGFDFRIHPIASKSLDLTSMYYNGVLTNTLITDTTIESNLTNQILGTVHTPISRPVFEAIPDPLGVNWATDRVGKPDSAAYLQNLIDTQGVADIPEGIYYIGTTLNIDSNVANSQGIIGKGTGKTIICGLTDDFPLITVYNSSNVVPIVGNTQGRFTFANLTLQGGSIGVYSPPEIRMLAFNVWKNVIFRDQTYGIHLRWNFGLDNNMIENLSFINCGKGIFNDPKPKPLITDPSYQDWEDHYLSYIDKTVFYKCQFINCTQAIDMISIRA